MHTYKQIVYQVVFATKYRGKTLLKEGRPALFYYISGILKNKYCHLYQVGGIEDHIHIVFSLHPSVALAKLVKDIKLGSTSFIKQTELFPDFGGWQDGYAAFTYSQEAIAPLVAYVQNQEAHHAQQTSIDELRKLFARHQIEYDQEYID